MKPGVGVVGEGTGAVAREAKGMVRTGNDQQANPSVVGCACSRMTRLEGSCKLFVHQKLAIPCL